MNRKDFMQAEQEAVRQVGDRAYAIWRQPWRVWRNRRLRAEIQAIMAESDRRWEQYKRTVRPGTRRIR